MSKESQSKVKDLQQTEQISTVESDKNKPSVKPFTRRKKPHTFQKSDETGTM